MKDVLEKAIEATRHPVEGPTAKVCPSHEGLRTGVHALLLCRKEDMFPEPGSDAEVDKTREVSIGKGLISFKNMTPKGIASIMWQCIIFLILTYIILNQLGFKTELKEVLHMEGASMSSAAVPSGDSLP